jgi:hypothetical protein
MPPIARVLIYNIPMGEDGQGLRYVPERDLGKEGIAKVGVGLLVVRLDDSRVWVIEELKSKGSTGRGVGDISFPLETRKKKEFIVGNVLGGLAEVGQLADGEKLIWVDGKSYQGRFPFIQGVVVDLVMLGLQNPSLDKTMTHDNGETRPVGWMTIEELRKDSRLRKGVGNLLDIAGNNRWIESFVDSVSKGKGIRTLDSSFDINRYCIDREMNSDV